MAEIRNLAADGVTLQSQQTWGPFISGLVEVRSTKIKFAIENISNRVLGATPFSVLVFAIQQNGTNDGDDFYWTAVDPNGTLSRPWGPDAASAPRVVVSAGGGAWVYSGTGEHGVVITAYNGTGETVVSDETTFTISVETKTATYTWVKQVSPLPIPTGYKIYRRDGAGDLGLVGTVLQAASPSFADDGSETPGVAPPIGNTTGGAGPAYGTVPADGAFTQADKSVAAGGLGLAIGQQWFFYGQVRVPAATSEVGNRRTLSLGSVES